MYACTFAMCSVIPTSVTEELRKMHASKHYASDWTYAEDVALVSEAYRAGVSTLPGASDPSYCLHTHSYTLDRIHMPMR